MSGLVASSALVPVIVVQFGSRCNNKRRRKKKRQRHNDTNNWHVCESLRRLMPSALSSPSSHFSSLLLIFLVILCSLGGIATVKGSETLSVNDSTALLNSYNNNGVPTFDVNDLKNLVEIFPEFREYVVNVLSSHVQKQEQQQKQIQQQQRNEYIIPATTTTPRPIAPFIQPTSGYAPQNNGATSPNSRRDSYLPSYSPSPSSYLPQKAAAPSTAKHDYSWGWTQTQYGYDEDFNKHHDTYGQSSYGYGYGPANNHHHHYPSKNYGYGPAKDHHHHHPPKNFGWGWSSDHEHKDPKYHYDVGYQIGKDFSCVLSLIGGLLGFRSVKDFSIHSIFSAIKKLKYVVLVGLAFKLGVLLSPLALPTLIPLILLAAIAKILPLLLIVILLFKLLKTQLKWGIGKRNGESPADSVANLLEGTSIYQLWQSIDEVTQSVVESEGCVERMICKLSEQSFDTSSNSTLAGDEARSVGSWLFGPPGSFISRALSRAMDWISSQRKWKCTSKDDDGKKIWECEKIEC